MTAVNLLGYEVWQYPTVAKKFHIHAECNAYPEMFTSFLDLIVENIENNQIFNLPMKLLPIPLEPFNGFYSSFQFSNLHNQMIH